MRCPVERAARMVSMRTQDVSDRLGDRFRLTVRAERDVGSYPERVRVAVSDFAALPLTRHDFHGDWN